MNSRNRKKFEQLGMPYGTACAKLKKSLLFDMASRLELLTCYQCQNPITKAGELSIEHKVPWLDGDVKLFWDLNNIAFSHLKCNSSAARRPYKRELIDNFVWCYSCKKYVESSLFPRGINKTPSGGKRECRKCNSFKKSEYRHRTGKR